MSVQVFRIPEAPYHKTTWAEVKECAHAVGIDVPRLRKIIGGVGATIISFEGEEMVDFAVLAPSAAWKQLLASAHRQESLF